eukprot:3286323-Prymnesium_polylepis.1
MGHASNREHTLMLRACSAQTRPSGTPQPRSSTMASCARDLQRTRVHLALGTGPSMGPSMAAPSMEAPASRVPASTAKPPPECPVDRLVPR